MSTSSRDEAARALADLDRTLHAPPRLAILTVLLTCTEADFTFLLSTTGLTKGNLASSVSVLEDAGLITARKDFSGQRPRTAYSLTGTGRAAIEGHWEKLEQAKAKLRAAAGIASTA